MHLADGDQALIHVGLFFRIRLMEKPFVAFSRSPGFVGIDPGDDDDLVLHLLLDRHQTAHIVQDSMFIVCRTGADNDQKFAAPASQYIPDLLIPLLFYGCHPRGKRKLIPDLCRGGQHVHEFKSHSNDSPYLFLST
jgi:hypothetical protein